MGLLAYDPGRLLALRGAVRVAAKDLEGFRCDDPMADAAMSAIALARQQLTELCMRRIQAILDANPLDGYRPTGAAPNGLGDAVVAARAHTPGWRLSSDPDNYRVGGSVDRGLSDPNSKSAQHIADESLSLIYADGDHGRHNLGRIDDQTPLGHWLTEQRKDHRYGGGSHWSVKAYTASFNTSLDFRLDPKVASAACGKGCDGVAVTIVGLADNSLTLDSGDPSELSVVGWNAGGILICGVMTAGVGAVVCGTAAAGVNAVALAPEDSYTTYHAVAVITPIDKSGTVAGPSTVVQAPIGVKISAQEMYEAQQHAGPDGLGQVAPAAGDVFVVMNKVEYDGEF
jgi:hypothetical protein